MMEIQITADDIANGKKTDPCGCPVALAARRQLGGTVLAFYYKDKVYVDFPGSIVADIPEKRYIGDEEMLAFMKKFDAGIPVSPQSFSMQAQSVEGLARVPMPRAVFAASSWRRGAA